MQAVLLYLRREPLWHFLALAVLMFALHAVFGRGAERQITIQPSDLQRLRAQAEQQWGRPPSAAEWKDLVHGWVREEVLVREARAHAMDHDDVVVRRRLVQKMEFLAQQEVRAPTEDDLQAHYRAHADRLRPPPRWTFEQRLLRPELHPESAPVLAAQWLQRLQRGEILPGDPSMVPKRLQDVDLTTLERDFGAELAAVVPSAALGQWVGPVRTARGWHLLRVLEAKGPDTLADAGFAAVRESVRADWLQSQMQQARDQAYAALLSAYTVRGLEDAIQAGAGPSGSTRP